MAKMLSCREAGMDCDFVARGETDDEVMRNGFEHGKRDHGMTDDMLSLACTAPTTRQTRYSLA
jgi:predicted small metal-binding protein